MASSPGLRAYAPPADGWEDSLHALVACGVLPALPPLDALRLAVREAEGALGLSAQPLLEAALACVAAQPAIQNDQRSTAALLLASAALESLAQARSTKTALPSLWEAAAALGFDANTAAASSEAARAQEQGELLEFLSSQPLEQQVERIVQALNEPTDVLRRNITKLLEGKSPESVAEVLQSTLERARSQNVEAADGSRKRTLTGLFFSEEKRLRGLQRQRLEAPELPPLPPLRGYQREVVGMVLLSWGLPLTAQVLEGVQDARAEAARLRGLTEGWTKNWVVRSPTNSGKTRMFIEVARALVAAKPSGPGSLVVVLAPTVPLTTQHTAYFERAQLPNTSVAAYSSDNQLTAAVWRGVLSARAAGRSHVAVCTPVSLHNLLSLGHASMTQIDLLVLDEAHHCHDDHPYAKVLEHVNRAAAQPRVLGLSASLVSQVDEATLYVRMHKLLTDMRARQWHVDEEDPEVAAVLSEPDQRVEHVPMRECDANLVAALQVFSMEVVHKLCDAVDTASAHGFQAGQELGALQALLEELRKAMSERADLQDPTVYNNLLGQLVALGHAFSLRYGCPNLLLTCRLLDLLRKAAALCQDELGARAGGVAAIAATGPIGSGSGTAGLPRIFTQLQEAAAALPSPAEVAAQMAAAQAAENPPPAPGNSCGDVSLRPSALLRELLYEPAITAALQPPSSLLQDCFASGTLQKAHAFPKFWSLLEFLQGYEGKGPFRGIIFVRTRQAVYHVADMIRRSEQLSFVQALELTGQQGAKGRGLASPADRHSRGMSNAQAQLVLGLFKQPGGGAKVLIATSVAEEGLDIPSCEFVVRYNAAGTGIQLLQSRGRARQKVAVFLTILVEDTLDVHLHAKSRREEANMRQYNQRRSAAARA
ncbi:hypothetical protein HYH03_018454 [Edaphochlamys debaryana]|uniref:Uncharacterized protein n=1 Tax=Edaphochlamys debaryana TaxID=47281 RepID=A0A835XFY8_9CHLO|nr:hypothetical protein HYH03_018454 [Edaphochlamys debaryana]|eukprot:KAG2482610.1 hypothetical protein HYH03_018454 [Edaphochlamys debaryana]